MASPTVYRTPLPRPRRLLTPVLAATMLMMAACGVVAGSGDDDGYRAGFDDGAGPQDRPDRLALTEGASGGPEDTPVLTVDVQSAADGGPLSGPGRPAVNSTTTWTGPPVPKSNLLDGDEAAGPRPSVPRGTVDAPFGPLPPTDEALAIKTPTGVVVPVVDERDDGWLVQTVCHGFAMVAEATPIGRAHVVLDAGHGGSAFGATGPSGLRESELNLQVATRTAEILRTAGATVVLTRTGDYTMTAASRGRLAKAIEPGLFVSIHHNGGAPPNGDRPGTLVYTKTASPESTRFGGLFHQVMQPMLQGAAEPKREAYAAYAEALDAYEAGVAAYDQSVMARDEALVANGQLPPEATTTIPEPPPVPPGGIRMPSTREIPPTTTTVPPAVAEPIPVPDTLPLPAPFEGEPVREFRWAGSGNAGVRSWTRPDGRDYLAVLRSSGDVPAVLAEFLYVTNPSEEELLADPTFIDKEAGALADAIILYFTTDGSGTGFVADQFEDQPIGGSGGRNGCIEPPLH